MNSHSKYQIEGPFQNAPMPIAIFFADAFVTLNSFFLTRTFKKISIEIKTMKKEKKQTNLGSILRHLWNKWMVKQFWYEWSLLKVFYYTSEK